jgi:hypothetical protein
MAGASDVPRLTSRALRRRLKTSPGFQRILREVGDLEEQEEYDVEEIMASITRHKRVLYLVKWLGFPRKKEWTYEPYENFSEGAYEKLLAFHEKNPGAPRDYRLQGQRQEEPASPPEGQEQGQEPRQGTASRPRRKGKEPASGPRD